ncbi:MAG TPA: hypothetical protein VE135_06620 [Pyrinomonadaceae bacterium]|nr:hypothetical protein [Pyrinomonadaceae bacterium]
MKMFIPAVAFCLVTFVSIAAVFPSLQSLGTDQHTEWIAKCLKEIESIKVGMTRDDLLRVFKEEGGISTREWRRYAYHDCPYIKVDVEFQPVGDPDNKVSQSPKDKIIKISKPFLEWSIMD